MKGRSPRRPTVSFRLLTGVHSSWHVQAQLRRFDNGKREAAIRQGRILQLVALRVSRVGQLDGRVAVGIAGVAGRGIEVVQGIELVGAVVVGRKAVGELVELVVGAQRHVVLAK